MNLGIGLSVEQVRPLIRQSVSNTRTHFEVILNAINRGGKSDLLQIIGKAAAAVRKGKPRRSAFYAEIKNDT